MAAWTTIPDSDVDPESPITTSLMQALRDNPVAIAEGASGAPTIMRNLHSDFTEVANVGAGEDDLVSFTVPANTLANDADSLRITAWGEGGLFGKTTVLKNYIDGVSQTLHSGPLGGQWNVVIVLGRTGAATQDIMITYVDDDATTSSVTLQTATATLSSSFIIKFTGENSTDALSDVVSVAGWIVEYIPAP